MGLGSVGLLVLVLISSRVVEFGARSFAGGLVRVVGSLARIICDVDVKIGECWTE